VLLPALLLAACKAPETRPAGVHYVTTIAPFAAILTPVVGGRGTVRALLAAGASPHTHDPRPSDVRAVAGGTALFYGAEHLDAWAVDLEAPAHVALLDLVPEAYRLALPAGVGEEHPDGIDPHFWTDPLAIRAMLPALADTLCALDAEGCPAYRANATVFATELDTLDAQLRTMLVPVRGVPVMLAQPFFLYFLRRYEVPVAGVVEVIPGKEATPRALQQYIEQARRQGVRALFVQSQLPARSAQAVGEAAGLPLYPLDPLGGQAGRATYAELLLYNARIIREALMTASKPSHPVP